MLRLGLLSLGIWVPTPVQAGEYFTEEVTSPSIEVVHGWAETIGDRDITVTNTSRGGIKVPLELTGNDCGSAEMALSNDRIQPLGEMEDCTVNLFPFLDKLINQEVTSFRVAVAGGSQIIDIPVSDVDAKILARVGNQSRESFLFFQQELARVLELFRQAANPSLSSQAVPPTPIATPAPTPITTPIVTPAVAPTPIANTAPANPGSPSASAGELIIVGQIQEERAGAGSRLSVEAINPTEFGVLAARARFDFYQGEQVIDSRTTAFAPSDVPPGERATASVVKTDLDWERVTVSFEWQRSSTPN